MQFTAGDNPVASPGDHDDHRMHRCDRPGDSAYDNARRGRRIWSDCAAPGTSAMATLGIQAQVALAAGSPREGRPAGPGLPHPGGGRRSRRRGAGQGPAGGPGGLRHPVRCGQMRARPRSIGRRRCAPRFRPRRTGPGRPSGVGRGQRHHHRTGLSQWRPNRQHGEVGRHPAAARGGDIRLSTT